MPGPGQAKRLGKSFRPSARQKAVAKAQKPKAKKKAAPKKAAKKKS